MRNTTLIAILVISMLLISCSKEPPTSKTTDETKYKVETVNIAGSEVRLTVATTNIERVKVVDNAQIEQNEDIYNGILYVYDGSSPITFRQKLASHSTDIAFLDESGKVVNIKELPPTPHNPDQIKATNNYVQRLKGGSQADPSTSSPEQDQLYVDYAKQLAIGDGFIDWAFPKSSTVNVKYLIQLPGGFFSTHKLEIGQTVKLSETVSKMQGDPKKPVIEFLYEPKLLNSTDDRIKKKYYTVDVAETHEKRAKALSSEKLNNLKSDEIVALFWKTSKQINFSVSDPQLIKPFYIVPIEIPEAANSTEVNQRKTIEVSGEFIFMEPVLAPNNEVGAAAQTSLKTNPEYRNYVYQSTKKYNCLMIFSKESVNSLNLKENMFNFGVTPEISNIKPEDDPEKYDVVYKIRDSEDTVKAKVKVIQDEIGRRRGLKLATPLPKFEKAENVDEKKVTEGYLLRFDRVRKRPIFSAGLKAPFDLALIDSSNKIVRVIEIPDETTLSTLKIFGELMEFSEISYQSIWIMPFKWFNLNGLAKTDENGDVQYTKGELLTSRTLSRTMPEPTRYKILVDNVPVWVEILLTDSERKRGLQYVQELKPNCGALFLYKNNNDTLQFWMPNCLMDLSVMYIDKNWFGKSVKQMLHPYDPYSEESSDDRTNRPENERASLEMFGRKYNSEHKVEFAIEMERGWFVKNNLARYKDDKYNTTEKPDEYYTDIEIIGMPKVTIIKGSPVELFLEHIKK